MPKTLARPARVFFIKYFMVNAAIFVTHNK
jgi:hypothetical protein